MNMKKLHEHAMMLGLYGAILTSAVCSVLLLGRVWWTGKIVYLPLGWNLLLAWIPFGVSALMLSVARWSRLRWGLLPMMGAVWLVFLPNAPYLITDLIHLKHRAPVPYWYDIAMLGMFACTGLLLGVRSLEHVHTLVRDTLGDALSWIGIGTVTGLCGLGIYLGRFLRWNSWDLITRPEAIFRDILERLLHPQAHLQTWGVTLVFGVSMLAFYVAIRERSATSQT